jgi:hypothetical protein
VRRLAPILAASLAACAFSPAALPPGPVDGGGTVDAPLPPDAAPPPDVAPDVTPAPDGRPDPCPIPSRPLLDGVEVQGTLAGPASYGPSCAEGTPTGASDIYRLEIPAASSIDLVVEVTPAPALDVILDVTQTCGGAGLCEQRAGAGAPEVAVAPFVEAGVRYLAVTAAGATTGSYTLRAFLRAVVSRNAICSPDLLSSRCPLAHHCLDLDDDGDARCEELAAVIDLGANDTPCTTPTVFTADGVYGGVIESGADVDVVELAPAGVMGLRAVVTNDSGGCSADLQLELLSGASCEGAAVVASDDHGGIGPCPLLVVPTLGAGRHWLRLAPSPGATVPSGASYTLVIDFLPAS